MRIYRLEHPDSRLGVWQHTLGINQRIELSKEFCVIDNRIMQDHYMHPIPSYNSDLSMKKGGKQWKCACESLEQFYHWFENDWIALGERFGFKVYEIEIDEADVQIGSFQVLFDCDKVLSQREITKEEYLEYFCVG
jgi:hypothetical protein